MDDFIKHISDELELLRKLSIDAPEELMVDLLGLAKGATATLKFSIEMLALISGAATESIPFALVPPCERLLRRFHPKACIIFKCAFDYNYELQVLPKKSLRNLTPAELLNKHFWPVIVVRIPSAPIADTLTHSLVSHELGHAIYNAVKPRIARGRPSKREIARVIGLQLGNSKTAVANIGKRISAVVENWIQEFYADTVGCLIVGPAFLCAYVSFLVTVMPIDRASRNHPRDRLRLQNILEVLRGAGYSDATLAEQAKSLAIEWERAIEEIPQDHYDESNMEAFTFMVAERIVLGSLPEVRKAALDATEGVHYQVSRYVEDVEPFVKLLQEAKIPPIERMHEGRKISLGLPSILNVGWETLLRQRFTHKDQIVEGGDEWREALFRQRSILNDMIFRSIDLGEIRRQWENAHDDSLDRRTT